MKKSLLFFCALFAITWANAQVVVTSEVNDALQRALNKDVDFKNKELDLQKMELERQSVLSKYIPKVEANAIYAHFNSNVDVDLPTTTLPIIDLPLFANTTSIANKGNVFFGGVTAKAVLYSGGQIRNGAKALEQKNQGTAYLMETRKDEVIKSVLVSFDQIQFLKQAEILIDESEKRLNKESERVEKAIAVGLAIPYDREKIKLATLELQSKRQDVQHKQELLALKIAQETDWDPAVILKTPHEVSPIMIVDELNTTNRNELKALEAFKKASEFVIKKEKGSYLPSLGAFGGYSYASLFDSQAKLPLPALGTSVNLNMNHLTMNPTWTVGVGMKWEIFSGFERKHKIHEAKIGLTQIENTLFDTREKLQLQLAKNQVEYKNALQQVNIAMQRQKVAENNNNLADKQYKAGLITITERLAAENDLYETSLKHVDAVIKQRQTAIETFQSSGNILSFITIK